MAVPGGVNQTPAQGVYRSIINSQYHLYENLDARFQVLARKIMEIAVDIAGEWVAENQRAGKDVTPEAALAEVGNRLSQYKIAFNDIAEVDALHRKLVALTLQYQNLHGELNRVRSERDRFAKELQDIQKARDVGRENRKVKPAVPEPSHPPPSTWAVPQPAPRPAPAHESEHPAPASAPVTSLAESREAVNAPTWYIEWEQASKRANRFAWDSAVLQVIGETGMSERQAIANEARSRQGVSEYNKRPVDALNRLVEEGLLTVRDAVSGPVGGRPPKLYQLTEKGQAAYVFLTRNRPQTSELATKAIHKSDAHTLLNARTARILQSAGYEILVQGERIELEGGHLFQPDITALHTESGEVIYVEVEMDVNKGDRLARDQKWQNCWAATGGNICLVTENRKSEMRILSEIRSALSRRAYRIRSFNHETGIGLDGAIWAGK